MSGFSSLRLWDLPIEILYKISHSPSIHTIFCLLRTFRFFYKAFSNEIYRLAAASEDHRFYLCNCVLLYPNTNALQLFIDASNDPLSLQYDLALEMAAKKGNEAVVRLLIEGSADANTQGGIFGTALQAAAYNGNEAMVRLLIERGTDVNAQVNARGGHYGTALGAAAEQGNEAVVRLLIDLGAYSDC